MSTSGPELWGFEFLGVRPPYTFHKHCSGNRDMPFGRDSPRSHFVKIKTKSHFQILRKSTLKFNPLKLRSLYPVGKILLFRIPGDADEPLWRGRLENGPVERLPSKLAPLTLTRSKSGGLNFVESCPEYNIQRHLASTL